jgi:hypothetical protein
LARQLLQQSTNNHSEIKIRLNKQLTKTLKEVRTEKLRSE